MSYIYIILRIMSFIYYEMTLSCSMLRLAPFGLFAVNRLRFRFRIRLHCQLLQLQ